MKYNKEVWNYRAKKCWLTVTDAIIAGWNLLLFPKWLRQRSQKKIICLLTQTDGNAGDAAIAYAQKLFLEREFSLPVLEFTYRETMRMRPVLSLLTGKEDLLCFPGGGNVGDLYRDVERQRQRLVYRFRNRPMVSFPQTLFFDREDSLCASAEQVYNSAPHLLFLCRDEPSLRFAQTHFPHCITAKGPDMTFCLPNQGAPAANRPDGALLCLRRDMEARLTEEMRQHIYSIAVKSLGKADWFDTYLNHNISKADREAVLSEIFAVFRRHKLVITDRFHGVAFAYLTNTPCIALDNTYAKVKNGCQWFIHTNYIFFIPTVDALAQALERAVKLRHLEYDDFQGKYFTQMKEKIQALIDSCEEGEDKK